MENMLACSQWPHCTGIDYTSAAKVVWLTIYIRAKSHRWAGKPCLILLFHGSDIALFLLPCVSTNPFTGRTFCPSSTDQEDCYCLFASNITMTVNWKDHFLKVHLLATDLDLTFEILSMLVKCKTTLKADPRFFVKLLQKLLLSILRRIIIIKKS